MHLQLLLLVTFITLTKCEEPPPTDEELCEEVIPNKIEQSLKMETLCENWEEYLRTSQPSSKPVGRLEDRQITEKYTPNTTCTSLPVNVKLTADNGTVTCSIQSSESLEQCAYSVTFYYEDQRIYEYIIRPDKQPYSVAGSTHSFDIRGGSDKYPNFSMILNRKSGEDRSLISSRSLTSSTLNGVYQCSIEFSPSIEKIYSNAIYYHSDKSSSPLISYKKMDESLIGKHLNCDFYNSHLDDINPCKYGTFIPMRETVFLTANRMKVTEVKHRWNDKIKCSRKRNKMQYSLKYYQTGSENVYEAECRINGSLKVSIEDRLPESYAERVCFGVNDKYVGCYLRLSEWEHFEWNALDQFVSNIMISKKKEIMLDESGEQVFTLLMKHLSREHRRFWCVKTFIFGTLLSERTFESNYVSKQEAKKSPISDIEMSMESAFGRTG